MRPQIFGTPANQAFNVAILLLKVLGTEEHPLGPDDLVIPRHAPARSPPA
jgi:hypothetical protein